MKRLFISGIALAVLGVVIATLVACSSSDPTATRVTAPSATATTVAAPVATATLAPVPVVPTAISSGDQPEYGGTLRYIGLAMDTLDPHMNTLAGVGFTMLWTLYDQLIHLDPNGDLVPELAESWDISQDGKGITFHLRQGVEFHDGTPLNAAAVKWNFDRMMDPDQISPRRAELAPFLESVEVVDDLAVRINLLAPFRPFLSTLGSDRMGFMISPTAVDKYGQDYGRNPVGAGAFSFAEWVPEIKMVMERNNNYWNEGKPYMDGVRFVPGSDAQVNLAMLRTGQVEMFEGPRAADIHIIEGNTKLKLGRYPGVGTNSLHFSPIPPFDNVALRQAIAYAIDRETYVDLVFPGSGRPAYVLERLGFAYDPDLKPIVFDQKKAREKLAEAGYPNGVTIPAWAGGEVSTNGEIMQAMLREVGIDVEFQPRERRDTYNRERGYYVTLGFNPTTGMGRRVDPHINIQRYFHSGGGNNYQGLYKNSEVDRLIEEAATVYDQAKARRLYTRIQTIIVGVDTIHVPFAENDRFFPHQAYIDGFAPRIHGRAIVRDLWFSK